MSWSSQGGGSGGGPWGGSGGSGGSGGRGPWGGNGGGQPPDFDEWLRRGQDRVRRFLPPGRGIWLIAFAVVAIWMASGIYRVQPDEQGVVLRFGEWVRTTQPGLNYHLPTPIETVITPKVTRVNRIELGFRSGGEFSNANIMRQVPEESLMLTGDENIVDINFTVFWVIKDAGKYLFNIRNPVQTVKAVAESSMREVIGQTPIALALAEGRSDIEQRAKVLLQQTLDEYGAGIEVTQMQLQKVDPPGPVIDAFRDVQRARADQERLRNEAEAYRNDIIPRARGEAERLNQEAQAYQQEVVARSEGDAARFISVYNAYKQAKDVTRRRLYLETMEEILQRASKIIIDPAAEGSGVVPYLPLPEIKKRSDQTSGGSQQGGQQSGGGR